IMLKAGVEVRERLGSSAAAVTGAGLLGLAALCVTLHLIGFAGGLWGSELLGFDRATQIAGAIGSRQKTLPVALILCDAYFTDHPLAVVPMVFYHFGQLIVDTFIAERLAARSARRNKGPKEEPTPSPEGFGLPCASAC